MPVITPNYRLARRIRLAWGRKQANKGHQAWATPAVYSLEQWWLFCLGQLEQAPLLASQEQQQILWESCVREHRESSRLLRVASAAREAQQAWLSLLQWQLSWHSLEDALVNSADGALFCEWAHQFEAKLQALGMQTLPQCIPAIAAQSRQPALVLAEFDDLSPLDDAALTSQAETVHRHQAQGDPASVYVHEAADLEQELQLAAAWAREQLQQGSSGVGILVPELNTQRHVAERALRTAFDISWEQRTELPFNVSAGETLASTPLVSTALALLSLLNRDPELESLPALLHSRYRDHTELEQEQELLSRLFAQGASVVERAELRFQCGQCAVETGGLSLGRQLLQLSNDRTLLTPAYPGIWGQRLQHCLEVLGWPGNCILDSIEYQQMEQFLQVLEQLRSFDPVLGQVDLSRALRLLQHNCDQHAFQAQTPETRLQVLGLLEGAGLQFEHLWICGMDDQSWPPAPHPNPYLPRLLQSRTRMPHADAEREWAYAKALQDRFLLSAQTLVFSFSAAQEGESARLSPLLEAAITELAGGYSHASLAIPEPPKTATRFSLELLATDSGQPASAAELQTLGGGSGLISDQSHCPFRALVHHRLGARAVPEAGVALNLAQRGTILHDALYRIWGQLKDQATLLGTSKVELNDLILRSAQGAVDDFATHHSRSVSRSYLALEVLRLQQVLDEWMQQERQRQPFHVIALEQQKQVRIGELLLNVRIDRVDQVSDDAGVSGQLLIDYKSGTNKVGDWLGERPRHPQLPLYTAAAPESVQGLSFARIKASDCAYTGISAVPAGAGIQHDIVKATQRSQAPAADWAELQEQWGSALTQLADEFVAGGAPVSPLHKNSCDYCGLQALCRVNEQLEAFTDDP